MNNSYTNTIIAIQQHYGFKSSKMCELLGGMNRQTFRNNKSKRKRKKLTASTQ